MIDARQLQAVMDVEAHKRAAAARAVDFVRPGMRLGLGTGSTAKHFIDLLAERVRAGLDVVGVPTSEATRAQAERLGIALTTLDETPELDLTVDGADEIAPDLTLIKGGGGALLREKIVAAASAKMIVIADESKWVAMLGRFPLPIEIVPFGADGHPPRGRSGRRRGGMSGAGTAAQGPKRPCFRHGWRALASRRPIAAHRRSAALCGSAVLRSPASWNTACSSASPGLLFSPARTGFASSSGLDLYLEGSTPMIARLCTRHAMAALDRAAAGRSRSPASAQAPAAADPKPSPAAILIAKQIVEIKGVKAMFEPLVRGVVEKVKNMFMQTNFMWAKDLNEVAANDGQRIRRRASPNSSMPPRAFMPAISPRRN